MLEGVEYTGKPKEKECKSTITLVAIILVNGPPGWRCLQSIQTITQGRTHISSVV